MSYPSMYPDSDPKKDYVTFSVPNHRVIQKIIRNSQDDEHLRIQISGRILEKYLDEIALLFVKYDIESTPIKGHQELRIRLCVPKPPEPPKSQTTLPAKGTSINKFGDAPVHVMKPNYVIHEPSWVRNKPQRRKFFIGCDYVDQPRRRRHRWCLYTIDESLIEG